MTEIEAVRWGDIVKKGNNLHCDKFTFSEMIKSAIWSLHNNMGDEDAIAGMSAKLLKNIQAKNTSIDMENATIEVFSFAKDIVSILKGENNWKAGKLTAERRMVVQHYDDLLEGMRIRKQAEREREEARLKAKNTEEEED